MRRKELKSRKKMRKNKRLLQGVRFSRKKESVFENYFPAESTFEIIKHPGKDNKKNRKEEIKYGEEDEEKEG